MIINCECGKKKFNIDSSLIPKEGRLLKCGSCSKIWHYTPIIETKNDEELDVKTDGNVVKNEDNQDNLLSPSGPSSNSKNSKLESRINDLNSFVHRGGNVIYLSVPGKIRVRKGPNLTFIDEGESYLPVEFVKNISQGLWDGILHINSNHKIFKNLRCLICQGQSIYDSQSDFAESMKIVVRKNLSNGMSEKDIYQFMKKNYGECHYIKILTNLLILKMLTCKI